MTITDLAYEIGRKPSTLRQWIKRNGMAKYFIKVSKNKVLPTFLITDFIDAVNEKISLAEFHRKWINSASLSENMTFDDSEIIRDSMRDKMRDTCVTDENLKTSE